MFDGWSHNHLKISVLRLYSETCGEGPPMKDQPATGDHLLMAVVLFIRVQYYTSDGRPPLMKDHLSVALKAVSGRRLHYSVLQ